MDKLVAQAAETAVELVVDRFAVVVLEAVLVPEAGHLLELADSVGSVDWKSWQLELGNWFGLELPRPEYFERCL